MRILLLAVALVTFAGCASTPPVMSPQVAPLFKPRAAAASGADDFQQTLAGCQAVVQGLAQQSTQAKYWSVGMATAGGLLGAVFLPVAVVRGMAESVVTLLGAASGFANTEQSVIQHEALDATSILISRASLIAAMGTALNEYYTALGASPANPTGVQIAVDKLKVSCITYYVASPNSAPITVPAAP